MERWEKAHGYELYNLSFPGRLQDAVEIDNCLEVVCGRQGAVEARVLGEGWSPRKPDWRTLIKNRKARKKIGVPI